MAVEFLILLSLVISIIGHLGAKAFPLGSFSATAITSGAPGIAVMLAFTCFIGFESAALYSEESHYPKRSIAGDIWRRGYLRGFYVLTAWVTVGAVGADKISDVDTQSTGTIYFDLTASYLPPWASDVMAIAMATSLFATALSIHNVASRYIFALRRQACIPAV